MAAGSTYTPIATTTLGSATNSVTFTSISGSYTDLVLVIGVAHTSSFDDARLYFNGDSGTNYSATFLIGNGSAASSTRVSNTANNGIFLFGTEISTNIAHIMNYSNSTTYKTALVRANSPSNSVRANVMLWRNTSAINSIEILGGQNFTSGSTFTLYGIAAAYQR